MVAFGGGAIASKLTGLFQIYDDQVLFVAFSSEDNESLWSNFSFFFIVCYFLEFLDGIKEKAPTHQKG